MTCTKMYEKPKHFAKSLHHGGWSVTRGELKDDFFFISLHAMDLLSPN